MSLSLPVRCPSRTRHPHGVEPGTHTPTLPPRTGTPSPLCAIQVVWAAVFRPLQHPLVCVCVYVHMYVHVRERLRSLLGASCAPSDYLFP